MSQFPQKLHGDSSNLTVGNAVDDWKGTKVCQKSDGRRAELFNLEGTRMESAVTEMPLVMGHARHPGMNDNLDPSAIAERLVNEVRAEMRIEFDQAVSAAFDRVESAIHDARRAFVGRQSFFNEGSKSRVEQAVRPKSSAQMECEMDIDILYSSLSNDWQETKAIFKKAKHLGFRTSQSNCLWRLKNLLREGFVELDRSHIRQRWRAI